MIPTKPITIEGQKFEYCIMQRWVDHKCVYSTHFYQGMRKEKYRKYFFFGETLEREVENFIFRLYGTNIESPYVSKEELKGLLDKEMAIMNRRKEIENGNII